jgi:hypothetical protein
MEGLYLFGCMDSFRRLIAKQPGNAITKLLRVKGRTDFHVVVEINKYVTTLAPYRGASACLSAITYFLSPGPGDYAAGPYIERIGFVTAGV